MLYVYKHVVHKMSVAFSKIEYIILPPIDVRVTSHSSAVFDVVHCRQISTFQHSTGLKFIIHVRLQRLSEYPVFLSTVKRGDCPSLWLDYRGNVGFLHEVSDYRGYIVV